MMVRKKEARGIRYLVVVRRRLRWWSDDCEVGSGASIEGTMWLVCGSSEDEAQKLWCLVALEP